MIRGDGRQRLHPLVRRQRRFRGKQFVEDRIGAAGIESQCFGAPPVAVGVGAERTAYQFIFAIERGGHTVHRTDESAFAAADHAIANFRPTVHRIPSARIHKIVCIIRFQTVTSSHRSEEHTSELQSLMRISYAVFCLKKYNLIHTYHTKLSSTTT